MRRVLLFGLAAFWTIAAAPALADPKIPASAIDEREKLVGEKKVRYLLRQLDLTEEQATDAQGLIETLFAGQAPAPRLTVDRVREIWAEIEAAKKAGDQKKVDALTKQLRQMEPGDGGEAEFFTNMESHLTDEQKMKLEQARARLKRNPSGGLRPIDLLRAAQALDLTQQQQHKLREVHATVRKRLGPILRPSESLKLDMINICAEKMREMLTPDQRLKFEYHVRALRPDFIDHGLRVSELAELSPPETSPDD